MLPVWASKPVVGSVMLPSSKVMSLIRVEPVDGEFRRVLIRFLPMEWSHSRNRWLHLATAHSL